jgi:hypothetical protein
MASAKTLDGIGLPEAGLTETEIAETNLAAYEAAGVRVRRNWDRRAPFVPPDMGHDFLDHLYRLISSDGVTTYVSEPYGMDGESLEQLAQLRRDGGWRVWIGQFPLWYPGRTTPIHFRPLEYAPA